MQRKYTEQKYLQLTCPRCRRLQHRRGGCVNHNNTNTLSLDWWWFVLCLGCFHQLWSDGVAHTVVANDVIYFSSLRPPSSVALLTPSKTSEKASPAVRACLVCSSAIVRQIQIYRLPVTREQIGRSWKSWRKLSNHKYTDLTHLTNLTCIEWKHRIVKDWYIYRIGDTSSLSPSCYVACHSKSPDQQSHEKDDRVVCNYELCRGKVNGGVVWCLLDCWFVRLMSSRWPTTHHLP